MRDGEGVPGGIPELMPKLSGFLERYARAREGGSTRFYAQRAAAVPLSAGAVPPATGA